MVIASVVAVESVTAVEAVTVSKAVVREMVDDSLSVVASSVRLLVAFVADSVVGNVTAIVDVSVTLVVLNGEAVENTLFVVANSVVDACSVAIVVASLTASLKMF